MTVDVCPLTPAPSTSTPTRIAVPTGTSRGVSTRKMRTLGARSPVTVTGAIGTAWVLLKQEATEDDEVDSDADDEGDGDADDDGDGDRDGGGDGVSGAKKALGGYESPTTIAAAASEVRRGWMS